MKTSTLTRQALTRGTAALALGATLVLSGCSSDSDEGGTGDDTSEEESPAEEESPSDDASE
ncbi:hypothetical protein [Nocardioides sp. CFH 31398]|uniref:hypothetical protein n=1 Tax=Nocardioides sp. CFH 31398 TaxID=2919579 RepID=UPI001F05C6C5|nr:hypothetical protein [Nocardioides sp. CFH 31398]MCH1866477.1 hypothetical protein [Nocardioides sp. CFH 31398]